MSARLTVGGQAVLEGVMMRGPKTYAVAVRRPDGTIVTTEQHLTGLTQRHPLFKKFPFRGVIGMIDTFVLGMRALSFSAEQATGEEEALGTKDVVFSFALAMIFVIGLFIILPAWLSSIAKPMIGYSYGRALFEGVLRITLFVGYIAVVSRMKDIRRVFEYHGAEHKAVHAYEHGKELTPANTMEFSPLHVGCGTAYLMMVMIIAIFIFAFIPKTTILIRIGIQIILLPVIASLSYEITRLSRRFEGSWIIKILMAPGLGLQKITALEPDEQQIEVAITALDKVLEMEQGEEKGITGNSA